MKLFWLFIAIAALVRAEPLHFASGAHQTVLIELYTSEGCSSCPSAERWLAGLREESGLWRDFVPLSFHVNYWDNLGWPDRFASRQFTQRQYAYAAVWGGTSVYTPCFVRNGEEWQPSSVPKAAEKIAGVLAVNYDAPARRCQVEFLPPQKPSGGFEAHVAILGGGLASKVTAGENAGETLQHEFVVLAVVGGPMNLTDSAARAELTLPNLEDKGSLRRALAVWVTRRGDLAPLQATGGWVR